MSSELMNLSREITLFLERHAKISADYDPDFDEPHERFSSPDAALLYAAAERLASGELPEKVLSSWGSGGFKPYSDKEAQSWHDDLVSRVNSLQNSIKYR